MNRKPWAEWELRFLREEYGGSLTRDIARALNRGIDAVRARVLAMGLQARAEWTGELDEMLSLMWPDTAAPEIGELLGRTAGAIRQRAADLGLQKDASFTAEHARRTTLARSRFTAEVRAVIGRLYTNTPTEEISALTGISVPRIWAYAKRAGLAKSLECVRETARARSGPDHPMRQYQFKKGNKPANAGVKGWDSGGRSHETRFVKGQRSSNWMPIGSTRVNADGYLDRKVADTGYMPDDWKAVHRLVWIEARGPVPDGHVVRFKPGRKTTDETLITLDALECITLAENGRRNVWSANLPPHLRKVMGARIALTRAINRTERELRETP